MASNMAKLTCPFFLYNKCIFTDGSCDFSHDPRASVRIPDTACFFYVRGNCQKGPRCPKQHKSITEILAQVGGGRVIVDAPKANVEKEKVTKVASSSSAAPAKVENKQPDKVSGPPKSYAFAASTSVKKSEDPQELAKLPVCSFFEANGFCTLPDCYNVHGQQCELCGFYSIHPHNAEVREKHRKECVEQHEREMEASFAFQRSKELACGICLDVVIEKEARTNRFGLLENCAHVYCLECIRTWRKTNFDNVNKRSCPQCRVKSDFVIPSEYYYETSEDKQKIIGTYKKALNTKHCKYFKKGQGKCPFGGACFYKHEYPDGKRAELPMPQSQNNMRNLSLQTIVLRLDTFMLGLDSDSDFDDESVDFFFD